MPQDMCERCGRGPMLVNGIREHFDYCAKCARDLCGECALDGCCGNQPMLSGGEVDGSQGDLHFTLKGHCAEGAIDSDQTFDRDELADWLISLAATVRNVDCSIDLTVHFVDYDALTSHDISTVKRS